MRYSLVLPLTLAAAAPLALAAAPPKKSAPKPAAAPKKPAPLPNRKNPIPTLGSRGGAPAMKVKGTQNATPPAPSQLPTAAPPPPPTVFQTNRPYDPKIDLKTEFVAVHKHGAPAEEVERAIRSWTAMGYPVHRMFFIGSDAGRVYTGGKADGTPHLDEVESDAAGKPIVLGDRPYMVPTAGWLAYLKGQIRAAIDAGATGIWPEEPLLHAAGGYSPAFKAAWQEYYQTPWQPPHGSPEAHFRGSRLKADLYLRAVDALLRYTKEYAREKGRDVKFLLPVHSPVSYAAWNLVFPHAAASRLGVDGVVAQVWTGPASTPVTHEGRTEPRFFESSWMLYSYFANLLDGVKDRPLYFLADPKDDDPSLSWEQYEERYREVVAASLLFPQAAGYEVMPWPERIYLPNRSEGGESPAPASYLTTLTNVMAALREIPAAGTMEWTGGTRGIGVVTLDTMMWQRGGPKGSSMRSLHGLALPLLTNGVPVEIVPGERAAEKAFLANFKVLLLSYDMQKPLGPEVNQALADWVKGGGTLLVFGGEDPYNGIGEWWNRSGFESPTDHLLRACGAAVEPVRTVRTGGEGYRDALKAGDRVRDAGNRKVYSLPLASYAAEGKPVFVRFTDLHPEDGWGPRVGRVRVVESGRVRADFVPGSAAEKPFLIEDLGTRVGDGHRFADGDASFVYRFNRLGADAVLELDLANQFQVSVAVEKDPGPGLQPAAAGLPELRLPSSYPLISYVSAGAQPLYRVAGQNALPAWSSPAGAGRVIYCGVPSAFGADGVGGAALVRALVRHACDAARIQYAEGPIQARRGPYLVAHALGRTVQLKGDYLDLFHPELPVLTDPHLPYSEPVLYKQVRLSGRTPIVLHSGNRARVLEASTRQSRLLLEGPEGTWGTVRLYPAGMSMAGVEAVDRSGRAVAVEARIEGPTIRIRYPQSAAGLNLTIRWLRPEARLTK